MKLLLLCALLLALPSPLRAAEPAAKYAADWNELDRRPMPEWFRDAKFGVFIHWGVYSVPAWGVVGQYSEWYWRRIASTGPKEAAWREYHKKTYGDTFHYMDFAPQFKAELFDAKQWADLFVRAGVRYVVPTSKHHDGYALWPSAEADRSWGRPWNAVSVGPRRDLMQEMADATRAAGLKFGFYYSLYEWFNPLWLYDRPRYVKEHMIPQFKDVVTRYAPAIIFSDGEWDLPSKDWKSEELLAWLFNESPSRDHVVVNDRWGKDSRHKHGGYWTTEYAAGLQDGTHAWEESRGMAYSYGFNRAERVGDYKTGREFILVLADLVSRGGNLLLDIGPAADGTIPALMEQRLLEIGDWLKVNGEAIYGTRPAGRSAQWTAGERPKQAFGEYKVKYELLDQVGQAPRDGRAVKQAFFTRKGGDLYAITAGWPGKHLVLRDLQLPAQPEVVLLGYGPPLAAKADGTTLTITLPDVGPEEAPGRHAYAFRIRQADALPEK